MDYKKYTICPSLELTQLNLEIINALMRSDDLISDSKESWDIPRPIGDQLLADKKYYRHYYITPPSPYREKVSAYIQTDEDPGFLQLAQYQIYNYLTETAKVKYPDNTIPPHSIDYIIDVNPRFHKTQTFQHGFLIKTVLSEWDMVTNTPIAEITTINEEYSVKDDSLYESTKTVDYRIKTRQWTTIEGTYLTGDEKVTTKIYDTVLLQREEGKRRRTNIFTFLSKDYFILRQLLLGETQEESEAAGFVFLKQYSGRKTEFIEGSWEIINYVENDPDSFLNTVITDHNVGIGTVSQVYPSLFQELVNNDITPYIGKKVKDRILDHLKGLV